MGIECLVGHVSHLSNNCAALASNKSILRMKIAYAMQSQRLMLKGIANGQTKLLI